MNPPSPTESNGRSSMGRFAPGNRFAKGNPYAAKVAAWRRALTSTVTAGDMKDVIRKLLESAKVGESWAVRELLDRTLGKPIEPDILQRLEQLETRLKDSTERKSS